jgi:hypothetical protein
MLLRIKRKRSRRNRRNEEGVLSSVSIYIAL